MVLLLGYVYMQRTLFIFVVGLCSGFVASVCALNLHRYLSLYYEMVFYELNLISIVSSSIGACLVASFLFSWLKHTVKRPVFLFVCVVFVIALCDSLWVLLVFPVPGLAKLANPLHFVVASVAMLFIPLGHSVLSRLFFDFDGMR